MNAGQKSLKPNTIIEMKYIDVNLLSPVY